MRYLLIALLLSGCSPYWVKSREPAIDVSVKYYETEKEIEKAYSKGTGKALKAGEHMYGFAVITSGICFVHVLRNDACGLRHELAHCQGWEHDDRGAFVKDCGPE